MRITADTNLLVRVLLNDDPEQAARARDELRSASSIILTTPMLCELAWVLSRTYGFPNDQIATALRTLTASDTSLFDEPTVTAGLAMLDAGGDFADGVIARLGAAAGSEIFVSFDKVAVARFARMGHPARLPAS